MVRFEDDRVLPTNSCFIINQKFALYFAVFLTTTYIWCLSRIVYWKKSLWFWDRFRIGMGRGLYLKVVN